MLIYNIRSVLKRATFGPNTKGLYGRLTYEPATSAIYEGSLPKAHDSKRSASAASAIFFSVAVLSLLGRHLGGAWTLCGTSFDSDGTLGDCCKDGSSVDTAGSSGAVPRYHDLIFFATDCMRLESCSTERVLRIVGGAVDFGVVVLRGANVLFNIVRD